MKTKLLCLIFGLMCFLLPANPLDGCVGRLLVVAVADSTDQLIMGQMLSVLINERTGTAVEIVKLGDLKSCHEAVLGGKANIYINYIGIGLADTGGVGEADSPQVAYTLVSQRYKDEFGMIWLKPFGFQGPSNLEANSKGRGATLAVPIATKDVLRKFPVLDRLINKLGGRIDNSAMDELRKKSENEDIKEVVREFLEAEKLI